MDFVISLSIAPRLRRLHADRTASPLSLLLSQFAGATVTVSKMGVAKKVRKFGAVKRMIGQRDSRLKKNADKGENEAIKAKTEIVREIPQVSSALFFQVCGILCPKSCSC